MHIHLQRNVNKSVATIDNNNDDDDEPLLYIVLSYLMVYEAPPIYI